MTWWRRLFNKRALEAQLEKELRFHLERQASDYMRSGRTEKEALRAARISFGAFEEVKEECREARGTLWLESTLQDLQFAVRTLRKSPGFALAAICTLALGIGANTAIFSVINGVILRALPYHDPAHLVAVDECLRRTGEPLAFSYLDFLDFQRQTRSFETIAAARHQGANLTDPGEPEYVHTLQVSHGFFSVLGVNLEVGRTFRADEDRQGAASVVIIGHSVWQQRFGGRHDVLGQILVLNGKAYTVVGVAPAGFRYDNGERQIFVPIGQLDDVVLRTREFHPGIRAVARLKQGITLQQANSEANVIGQRLAREYPTPDGEMTFRAEPLKQYVIGDVAPTLFLLAGAVGLVLLIACANVANLFLTRSLSRVREFSVRAALGASRRRLIRQLLVESLLLSFAGGAVGWILALQGTHWALLHLPDWLPRSNEVSFDFRILLFTLVISALTGIVFGIVPALRQQVTLNPALAPGARATTRGILRLQSGFVIAELALALILLTGAGLMIRTLAGLWSVNPGFDQHHLLTMSVGLSPKVLQNPALIRADWQQILDRVRSTPGVEGAYIDSLLPLGGDNDEVHYWTTAATTPPKDAPIATLYTPSPGCLETMKIPLIAGRFFTEHDRLESQRSIVIDQTLAHRVFGGQNPIGRTLSVQFVGISHIVGVIGPIKQISLDEDANGPSQGAIYFPFFQLPDEFMRSTASGMGLVVRTAGSPTAVIQAVKSSVLGPDRDQPVRDVATMEQLIADSIGRRRAMLVLLGTFAGLSLVLASIGIYGVISYWTVRRVQEVGVRMALGARPAQVLQLFLSQGLRMIAIGVAGGAAASFVLTRLMSRLLYGVSPADPMTHFGVVLTLAIVASAAIYIPARRAARTDPMVALRYE
ncbi:MAG: ABC transporter permease [Acidobacteriaceae bacterium]|nr:ABC transporter permease [Acidobacteriaceae bacterium]MBV9501988.1 ABC transporter permease [Acidobacteriaceae bacterium]